MAEVYRVVTTKHADRDIDRILLNINNKYGAGAARNAYDAILEKIESLATMPEAHPVYESENQQDPLVYRWVVAKKVHSIIYTFEEEEGVIVVRVRHVKELSRNVSNALIEEE